LRAALGPAGVFETAAINQTFKNEYYENAIFDSIFRVTEIPAGYYLNWRLTFEQIVDVETECFTGL